VLIDRDVIPYIPWSGATRFSSWDPKYLHDKISGVQAIDSDYYIRVNLVGILFYYYFAN